MAPLVDTQTVLSDLVSLSSLIVHGVANVLTTHKVERNFRQIGATIVVDDLTSVWSLSQPI